MIKPNRFFLRMLKYSSGCRKRPVWRSYKSADFADMNGDGNSDVSMTFVLSDGDTVAMTWLWDSEQEAYIFNEELSSVMGGPEK